tara:strand:- start:36 stop:560 length:525 start_codon:yes stop_codon:yes gene_type:complete
LKLNLFSIPVFIGNIDANKIKMEPAKVQKTWHSETLSTHNSGKKCSPDSIEYILKTIVKLLDEEYTFKYQIELKDIWENKYKNSFQDTHIHRDSEFSFIIYKKLDKSKTVFNNPAIRLIECFHMEKYLPLYFEPECRSNQIIVFPSFLEHWVKLHKNSITFAGNINFFKKDPCL